MRNSNEIVFEKIGKVVIQLRIGIENNILQLAQSREPFVSRFPG